MPAAAKCMTGARAALDTVVAVSAADDARWIAVIGDRMPGHEPQDTMERSLVHAAEHRGLPGPEVRWLPTEQIEARGASVLDGAAGVWCSPGSPYRSMSGALTGIRAARERRLPFLGTCAGFQHGVIEFARNVLGHAEAAHAEYGDEGVMVIDELQCSIVGQQMAVDVVDDAVAGWYGSRTALEQYYCRFGLNPAFRAPLQDAGLLVAGVDVADGDVRIMRIADHPWFVLTLFVPQVLSAPGAPHPLIAAFLDASLAHAPG